jgi:hypothetical protein
MAPNGPEGTPEQVPERVAKLREQLKLLADYL